MVDSRVRDQSSPSPVKHIKNAVGFNERVDIKIENINNFPHTIMHYLFPVHSNPPNSLEDSCCKSKIF